MKGFKAVPLLILGCLLIGCGTEHPHPAVATAGPAMRTTPSLSVSPSPHNDMFGTCRLGYLGSNSTLLARTAAYAGSATAALVTLTNLSGTGVTLTGFDVQISYHGQVIVTNEITSADGDGDSSSYQLPIFMTEAQVYSQLVELDNLPNAVNVSFSTYQQSACKIIGWSYS